MRIMGVDIDSRKCGTSLLGVDHEPRVRFFESGDKDWQKRIFHLYDNFKMIINSDKPEVVFIEESMYAQNFRTSKLIAEAVGNCKLLCHLNLIPFITVPNKKWKKEVIGNGNASKDDIKDFIIKKYPLYDDEKQDVYDAMAISLYGRKVIEETR